MAGTDGRLSAGQRLAAAPARCVRAVLCSGPATRVAALGTAAAVAAVGATVAMGAPRGLLHAPLGLLAGAAALLALRALAAADPGDGTRRGWFLLAASLAAWFGGESWAVAQAFAATGPVATSLPGLAHVVLLVAAIWSFAPSACSRHDRVKLWLDTLTAGVGGGFYIVHLLVLPRIESLSSGEGALQMARPLADLALLVGASRLLLRPPGGMGAGATALLASGALVVALGDTACAGAGRFLGQATGPCAQALTALAFLLLAASAERTRLERPAAWPAAAPGRGALLPFAATVLGYGLLVAVAFTGDAAAVRPLAVGATLLTAVVLARQALSVRENLSLQAAQSVRASEDRFRSLVQHSTDVITILSPDGVILYASPATTRVLGYSPSELAGRRLAEYLAPEYAATAQHLLERAVKSRGEVHEAEWRIQRADGAWVHAENRVTNLLADPNVGGLVVNTRDVSERHALEGKLYRQAFHDGLTALANRTLLRDRLEHALLRGARREVPVALLFVDLDDFKAVNDSLGHHHGDDLLRGAADRLRRCVREGDTVARLGGDEFAVLMEEAASPDAVAGLAERITRAFQTPFALDGHSVPVTATVGIAVESPGDTVDALLRNADVAMYAAKAQGRGRWAMYDPSMHSAALELLEMQSDLSKALERGEIRVHYQPVVRLADGRLWGVEALARWQHPVRGWIPPSSFVPVAERMGLIVPLGEWILQQACRDAAAWVAGRPDGEPVHLTVNLSTRQLREPGLAEAVARALAVSGLPPHLLVLELTEGALIEDDEGCRLTLEAFRRLGARVAIDDFGTGYSSLSYLQRFPLDVLKVAKAFVDRIRLGQPAPLLARAIVGLGRTMGLVTIAEGVELPHQAVVLREMQCDLGQGYLWSHPVTADSIADLLRTEADVPLVPQ